MLGPKQPLSWTNCAPLTLDEKATFFAENGFVVVPKCFEGNELRRLQASWRRAQVQPRSLFESWRGKYRDKHPSVMILTVFVGLR